MSHPAPDIENLKTNEGMEGLAQGAEPSRSKDAMRLNPKTEPKNSDFSENP